MPVGTVRIYDLARDLKQDTKRVIEELRREGADVSVPSNSVSKELAEKIRNKYIPKVDVTPKRTIKVIKREKIQPIEAQIEEEIPKIETAPQVEKVEPRERIANKPEIEEAPEKTLPKTRKLQIRKVEAEPQKEPIFVEEKPPIIEEIIEPEIVETQPEEIVVVEEIKEVKTVQPPPEKPKELQTTTKIFRPTGTQVKILTLTKEARESGLKAGDRIVSEAPTKTGKLKTDKKERPRRDGRGGVGRKPELRGTTGETATPKLTYTPPADQRKKFGRS